MTYLVAVQPENLLLVDKKDDANLKIADFGFAKKHDSSSEVLKTQCGTPGCKKNLGSHLHVDLYLWLR